jgi:ClpX C4-type zinc finger
MNTSKPITVDLPERATIFELAMTSPTEGWLVGAVFAPDHRTVQSGLIMRYHDHAWRPIDDPLPVAFLDGIAMVSADEGWVTGYTQNKSHSYLLHYTGGHWQPVAVPFEPTGGSYYGGIRMRSADEGWIVVNPEFSWKGQIESLLLHYRHGAWTPVTVPTPLVWDFAPVGPDDLWLVGSASVRRSDRRDSTLAHFQQGRWTATPAPDHALLGSLRMWSASAGYAVGSPPQPPGWKGSSPPPAVVLRYDGRTWDPIQTGTDPAAQQIELFDDTDAWAFVRTPPPLPLANDVVSAVQRTVGQLGSQWQWRAVSWPFTDIIHIGPMVRAAPGEYWAAAKYVVPPEYPQNFHWELVHFTTNGSVDEYPPRGATHGAVAPQGEVHPGALPPPFRRAPDDGPATVLRSTDVRTGHEEQTMASASERAGDTDRTASCAFCGHTNTEGVRLIRGTQRPEVAICSDCVTNMERMVRRELGTRLSQPPAPSPSDTYPLIGVPRPFYHQLLQVIPILQTHRHGAFELTVVSLEVYSESLLLVLWIQAVPQEPEGVVVQPLAWVTMTLADDVGTQYSGGQMVSTTGTGPGYYHGRVEYSFAPTLNPAAHELRVRVPELRWEYYERGASGGLGPRLWGEELEPPWAFTLPLPPLTK